MRLEAQLENETIMGDLRGRAIAYFVSRKLCPSLANDAIQEAVLRVMDRNAKGELVLLSRVLESACLAVRRRNKPRLPEEYGHLKRATDSNLRRAYFELERDLDDLGYSPRKTAQLRYVLRGIIKRETNTQLAHDMRVRRQYVDRLVHEIGNLLREYVVTK